jgi:hypothetical protein
MEAARPQPPGGAPEGAPHFVDEPAADEVRAWEEVESGRYMPRRTRGSCKGRALG